MRYLVFQLYAPLASWGEPATGEIRRSATRPGRSAVLGLLGAALGIRRDDEAGLRDLADNVAIAVKQVTPGVSIQDYHTTQVPPQDRKARRFTRRDELYQDPDRLHTILSTREYRCDGYWLVAVRLTGESAASRIRLEGLASALKAPRYPLYLGRKSCPPAAPLSPRIIEAAGIQEAFGAAFPPLTDLGSDEERRRLGRTNAAVEYAWEGESGDLPVQETRFPYDDPVHRGRWQFAARPEHWWCGEERG